MANSGAAKSRHAPGAQAGRLRQSTILVVAALLALVLTTTIVLTINNNNKLGEILEESVESELLATCTAARNEVDVDLLMSINSEADFNANRTQIDRVLKRLRDLKNEVEATYIYALKEINGKYYFIFDTDEEAGTPDNPIFDEYELSPVHEAAFAGRRVADHVEDEWGSYNTGAIPIYRDGKVVGIICADFEDFYIERSQQAAALDTALLIAVMVSTMIILLGLLVTLLRRNQKMQENLFYVANHDAITGLYNRYYLFTYLAGWNKSRYSLNSAFTLLFIDLDNFKRVNDNAGHDEGDKLLRLISDFFKEYSNADASSSKIESLTARIGGDEFVQVIADIGTPKGAEQRARAMLRDFAARPELQEYIRDYDIGLSIGGALFPSQSGDYSELLRFADIAMYQAKYNGKNNYCLYNESLGDGPEGVVLSIRKSSRSNTKDA